MAENTDFQSGTLETLLMKTGPLQNLMPADKTWPELARGLKKVFEQRRSQIDNLAGYYANLGVIYCAHQKKPVLSVQSATTGWGGQLTVAADFLLRFITANGQLGYVSQQDWYTSGAYVLGIDVNYYPDRSGYKFYPLFHKDTGGNNIFADLIFDNEQDIEATEWFADVAEPSRKRAAWQQGLLPESHLKALAATRTALRDKNADKGQINGGISKGKYIYVSWVDDLVWHATPSENRRVEYDAAAAERAYQAFDDTVQAAFSFDDHTLNITVIGPEILATIGENPDTSLRAWLRDNDLTIQDIDFGIGARAWQELYHGSAGRAKFLADAQRRAKADWRIIGSLSEVSAPDDRLPGSVSLVESPVSLSSRRRANSLGENQAVRWTRQANEKIGRSFIRMWLRVLPKDSDELTKAGVVFT